ncbi:MULTISPECIES: hypothetical protein [Streptomyces]|uniref:Uncharacterized protein n=1 Tax=Streptomyces resistomycificus TaxID=67356 RepID=A0A0L8L5D2_9ACTN|nr:hypothetical protein [Streptomyces resistomycificus]KOG33276.1 hypothetical protein ADK37_23070 [Streptomyces resistomycificus]KUN99472.1 hypothetical protein AQJ84_11020 [Streptomyces resistomycificus]
MSTPNEWLREGEIVTLGRFDLTCQVIDATPTSDRDALFTEREARRNPMIYRFRDVKNGDAFCLSHSALTEEELKTRRSC